MTLGAGRLYAQTCGQPWEKSVAQRVEPGPPGAGMGAGPCAAVRQSSPAAQGREQAQAPGFDLTVQCRVAAG